VSEVPTYYLMYNPDARAYQFSSTFFISYTEKNGTTLTGDAGYEQAVRDGYFKVIAYDNSVTVPLDRILARMLMNDPQYRLAATLANSNGLGTYYVWVRR
jgi:hypothetical protein